MKGIVLAGGSGTRLYPVTKGVNKHLLPVYDKPMIHYPISVLKNAGITDILVITTDELRDIKAFNDLLGDGSDFNLKIRYAVQSEPNGIAEAFIIANDCGFLGNHEPCTLILGDNVFHSYDLKEYMSNDVFDAVIGDTATIYTYDVSDPERYGVIQYDDNDKPIGIVEKPKEFVSSSAVVGLYIYPRGVVSKARSLTPSARDELEITDLNNLYFKDDKMRVQTLGFNSLWLDTGTHDSLIDASILVRTIQTRSNTVIGDIYGLER